MKSFKLKKDWFNGIRKRKKGTILTCSDNQYKDFLKSGHVDLPEKKNTNDKINKDGN